MGYLRVYNDSLQQLPKPQLYRQIAISAMVYMLVIYPVMPLLRFPRSEVLLV